ncbi:Valine--tRNA ligase [Bienertia sinuspersici]
MDKRVLNLRYLDKTIQVVVDDIDKCVLLDVINDMCDEFEKRGWELPPYPGLHYCFREKAIRLTDDKTLMQMFGDIKRKEIDVWIGSLNEPTFIWKLARQLDGNGVNEGVGGVNGSVGGLSKGNPNNPGPSRQKLPIRRNTNQTHEPQSPTPQLGMRRSPRTKLPQILDEMSWSPPRISLPQLETDLNAPNSQFDEVFILPEHQFQAEMAVVPKHKPSSLPKPTSQPLNAEPNSELSKSKGKKVSARPVAFKHGKKMPKSTAKYKGVWSSQKDTLEQVTQPVSSSRPRFRARNSVSNNEACSTDVDCTSDISEEEEYVPQMSDEESDGYDDDGIDIEENPEDLIMENFVDGNWEPFRQTEDAYEDAGGYLSRVYKNGEIYDDADLGKIMLKPWQLFVDKDHLKEVLRDYCVQEGFALVVQKADNGRYTAECADTSKLLEDIRASPDIKGKAMNVLLDERFGVTMATSTLYKMKAKALQIIQGGHDQSYSNLIGVLTPLWMRFGPKYQGVTNAYSTFTFRKAMEQVQKFAGLGALKWLQEIGPLDRWAKWSFDPQLCCDENTNNFVESFNSTIGVNRTYPILTMLEGRGEYEVSDGRSMLPVSLSKKECVCGRWQISGIPCKHGIKAIHDAGKDPLDFVSEWYSVARYKLAYSGNISPIPDETNWPDMDVPKLIPPTMKRSIRRPSRNRRREEGEKKKGKRSTTVQCAKCKDFGHNSQTCKGGATKKEKMRQQCEEGEMPSEEAPKKAKKGEKPPKKAKKTAKAKQTEEVHGNLIELMISESQASHSCTQPQPKNHKRKATSDQPSTSAAAAVSPITQKIQKRIAMLG